MAPGDEAPSIINRYAEGTRLSALSAVCLNPQGKTLVLTFVKRPSRPLGRSAPRSIK